MYYVCHWSISEIILHSTFVFAFGLGNGICSVFHKLRFSGMYIYNEWVKS